MKKNNSEKKFDCLKMKAEIQAKVLAETAGMSAKEVVRYFNKAPTPKQVRRAAV